MRRRIESLFVKVIKFCPKTGKPVKALNKWIIPIFSILSLLWILIRVIPKPQRASYPCMKVAFPLASTIIVYFTGLIASVVFFKKAFRKISETRYLLASVLIVLALGFGVTSLLVDSKDLFASQTIKTTVFAIDTLGANNPIGEAKGIKPGRVVWVHNPDATNEYLASRVDGDAYFLDENSDQVLIDGMLRKALLEVTGEERDDSAWVKIFKYFNLTHDKGEIGYQEGEKIFIKINGVHAKDREVNLADLSIDPTGKEYGFVDTSPQVILAILRQLINQGGVPQEAIYIGDPMTNIFKHLYEKLTDEFPNVNYLSKYEYENRYHLSDTNTEQLSFSDKGAVISELSERHFDVIVNADYILNIPALKGHGTAGVTFFAKNHFGSHTKEAASHMHEGLHKGTKVNGVRVPVRAEYNMYRVFVDLMSYKHLGGKTLIYIADFLWGTSFEHLPPQKFRTAPFYDDWSSSILVSLDPVAISSVGVDIFREEFQVQENDGEFDRYAYPSWSAVDDYLHQAASSDWWPEGIEYNPNNDSVPISSLGVHEHWNNAEERKYSRNLDTNGQGIELIYIVQNKTHSTSVARENIDVKCYYSAFNSMLYIESDQFYNEKIEVNIYNLSGQLIKQNSIETLSSDTRVSMNLDNFKPGYYVVRLNSRAHMVGKSIIIK